MSDGGKITVSVDHSRNQETITISTTGKSGGNPVNTISNKVPYSSRTSSADPVAYWTGILNRAIAQL